MPLCSRLAKLVATKKGKSYATTMPWIMGKVSFAPLRSALLCLRRSRVSRGVHMFRTVGKGFRY